MSSSQDDLINLPDNELVKLAKQENADAFTVLFQRYKGLVYGYIMGLVYYEEEAADLTQLTFLKAWDKLPTLQEEHRFRPWLLVIARNAAFDHNRLEARTPSQSLEIIMEHFDVVDGTDFEEDTAATELVKLALAELPPKYRDCLLLLIEGKLTRDEIAHVLKIEKASLTTYICTARKLFREAYYRLKSEIEDTKKKRGSHE
jgi:RNA polymerase sigma-70 factor, ECF subfamily